MAQGRFDDDVARPLRWLFVAIAAVLLVALFLVWRIDSPRMERFRAAIVDAVVPNAGFITRPVAALGRMVSDIGAWFDVYEQNEELRREIRRLRGWRETALELEQKYARLLDLNKVKLNPRLTYVTALVSADSGSPFSRTVVVNVGREDGIRDGWAAVDSLGLAGRIAGVGARTARVLLITDAASRIPVIVQPSGQHAVAMGDNTGLPQLDLLESPLGVNPGDRVVTSGDGALLPPGLLVGQVVATRSGALRIRPAADLGRLEFLRILRSAPPEPIPEPQAVGAAKGALPALPAAEGAEQ